MRPCEHDRTVLSHPSTVPSPPDEARRLQPHAELLVVVGRTQYDWARLRRGAHRRIGRRVALQRGAERPEPLAEPVQRSAATELKASVLRVPPQGSQQRLGHGLRRQTRQVQVSEARSLQQEPQRVRGFERSRRAFASRRFLRKDAFSLCAKNIKKKHRFNLRRRHMIAVWLLWMW